jgi:hypothetical protein
MVATRLVCAVLTVSMSALPGSANAEIISTERAGSPTRSDFDIVRQFVHRSDVKAALEASGVPALEIDARLSALAPDELRALSGEIQSLPAGGASPGDDLLSAFARVVLAALLIAGVVMLIVYYFAQKRREARAMKGAADAAPPAADPVH